MRTIIGVNPWQVIYGTQLHIVALLQLIISITGQGEQNFMIFTQ
jgi:hypothetical protein